MSVSTFLGEEITPVQLPTQDEKNIALLAHILTLAGSMLFMLGGFLPPLIIYLLKKEGSSFVSEHAKESLNFQITLLIGYVISFVLMFVFIGFFMLIIFGLLELILVIVATIKASEGKVYRYPFNIRILQ